MGGVDSRSLTILVLASVALVWAMMLAGVSGIVVVALFATALTVGLRTGSLAPYYPTISRAETPAKFWLIMAACGTILVLNVVNLLVRG